MQAIVISAPFGNYVRWPGATSTLGTFTLHSRGDLLRRLWRCALTLRYKRGLGWVNRLGLPNPGIESLDLQDSDSIVSIKGFDAGEWLSLATKLSLISLLQYAELNLSCPNVGEKASYRDALGAAELLLKCGRTVITKLPPVRWLDLAVPMYANGVRWFHCCNTIPAPCGGLSGSVLKQYSLWACDELKQRYGSKVTVIGGGGVHDTETYNEYKRVGADHVAIGSALLNPFSHRRLKRLCVDVARSML